jgi:parvulin-like peptidyl-prolyl isomerase
VRPTAHFTPSAAVGLLTLLTLLVGCSPPPSTDEQPVLAADAPKSDSPAPKRAGLSELPPLPDVVAKVAGHEIARREFDIRYEPGAARILARRSDGKLPDPYQATQRETIIEALIWSKLLELEAERSGIDFTPEALAKMEADERRHVRDWAAWLERIGQTAEVRRQANIDYLRERALLEARIGPLSPSEEQLREAYEAEHEKLVSTEEMVRASHLQLAFGPRVADEKIQPPTPEQIEAATPEEKAEWDAAAKRRAEALRELALQPGVDFNELAREWSEGPGAFRGEDMGLFPYRQMVREYADAAFALEMGEISQPIHSDKGWYVIKSFGRFPAGPLPFEAVRADLVRALEQQAYQRGHVALKAELEGRFAVESQALDDARAYQAARQARKGKNKDKSTN